MFLHGGGEGMAEDYQMLEELGSGSFGTVYKAIDKATGDFVAIKHIDLEGSDDDIREIQQEISLLATCSSPYVTAYKTSFVRGTKLWIVMEYLGGGSCLDLLRPGAMEERYIATIMKELLQGLDYLHGTGKIHRDIKAANILLAENGRVKIADFGVAAQLTNIKSQRLTFVGTPFWMAPEVIQEAGYDFHADIWSLGITAMEMALGEPPRSDVHPMKVLFLIPKEKPPRLEGSQWTREFKDFVALCLNKDPDRRPSAKNLLRHSFIRRAGKPEMLRELVLKARRFHENGHDRDRDTKYYEETLREMSNADDEDDEWVFDTIKPNASMKALPLAKHTIKRRKLERIPSADESDVDMSNTAAAMEAMNLDADPLGDMSNSGANTPGRHAVSTIVTPKIRRVSSSQKRRSSAMTARKVSISSPTAVVQRVGSSSRQVSTGETPTARRVSTSSQQQQHSGVAEPSSPSPTRQPLGLDMSFGNTTSTVRQFRRVGSGAMIDPGTVIHEHDTATPPSQDHQASSEPVVGSPQDSVFDSDAENKPPPYVHPNIAAQSGGAAQTKPSSAATNSTMASTATRTSSVSTSVNPPTTKESLLGRRAYAKCLDPAFQEAYAVTASAAAREALARVAEAWAKLDEVDPEGELLLLKAMAERLLADPKVSAAVLPGLEVGNRRASTSSSGSSTRSSIGESRGLRTSVASAASTAVSSSSMMASPSSPSPRKEKRKSHGITPSNRLRADSSSSSSTAITSGSVLAPVQETPTTPSSSRHPARSSPSKQQPASGAAAAASRLSRQQSSTSTPGSRSSSPTKSPAKSPSKMSPAKGSPAKRASNGPSGGGASSPTKLVMNPQNPHLKKMRSNQQLAEARDQSEIHHSSQSRVITAEDATATTRRKKGEGKSSPEEDKEQMGANPHEEKPGMEHVGILADVLYGRWTEGLKARWPAS